MNACLRRYIDALPAGYRSVLLLSEDEGPTNPQIAEALGLTLDTVKIRLHRARARLRARLGSDCDLPRDEENELACEPKMGVSPSGGPPSIESEKGGRLSCLEYHVGKEREFGVDGDEVTQAVEMGKMVRRGAAGKMDKLVEHLRRAAPTGAEASTAGCCS